MATQINGFGIGLVHASAETGRGLTAKYDAVEGITAFYMLIYPRRCLHVLEFIPDPDAFPSVPFRFIPLRCSGRILAKGYLNSWGNFLFVGSAFFGSLMIWAFSTMNRKFDENDRQFVEGVAVMFVCGVFMKLTWYLLERRDKRIRRVIGINEFGDSDPYYWREDVTNSVLAQLPATDRQIELIDLAGREFACGHYSWH